MGADGIPPSGDGSGSSEPTSKRRRRRAGANACPGLKFLVMTHPDHSKKFRADVRSQAMKYHRYKDKIDTIARAAALDGEQQDTNSSCPNIRAVLSQESSVWDEHYSALPISLVPQPLSFEDPQIGAPAVQPPALGLYSNSTISFRPHFSSNSSVTGYEESNSHTGTVFQLLLDNIARIPQFGYGIDALPAFEHPDLDSAKLLRQFVRAFATESTIQKVLPTMLWHPRLILSLTAVASTWVDMADSCPGDSPLTTTVKGEIMVMVNERLESPASYDDATVMAILYLLAGEMRSCNEGTLRVHKEAVVNIITERGGLRALENSVVAEVATAFSYHCDIFCEAEQAKIFRAWTPRVIFETEVVALPESPLCCHRHEFGHVFHYDGCSQSTQVILRDMRDLTNLFLASSEESTNAHGIKAEDDERGSRHILEFREKAKDIHDNLASLPSAYAQGHVASQDWVYEACRIASLIYTVAIIGRVPFSVAARSRSFRNISNSDSTANPEATKQSPAASPAEALYEVLKLTDTANIWKEMGGVLYWVCAVGAAAARTPVALNKDHRASADYEKYQVWVRQSLVMHGARTLNILLFQHPTPIIMAQQKLLRVQEVLAKEESD